jgi:prepilin-type N-terminal cleavage/methylation domain-containing protein
MKNRHAFTLVEMLVVMAIIAIVAAMVVGMNSAAQTKKRQALVQSDLNKLRLMIDSYQAKLNFYPPDNGNLISNTLNPVLYDGLAATNPLLYELTGATNLPPPPNSSTSFIQFFDGTSNVTTTEFNNLYARGAVANANPDEPHSFFNPGPKTQEYAIYGNLGKAEGGQALKGLLVPVETVSPANNNVIVVTNFWHYDASTTNRHNQASYDLWAEYMIGSKNGANIVVTNGNW